MPYRVGEYVAACVAGVFIEPHPQLEIGGFWLGIRSVEDGLKLIAHRARLMQTLPATGKMVAVFAEEKQVKGVIQAYSDRVSIAAINGSQHCVISIPVASE